MGSKQEPEVKQAYALQTEGDVGGFAFKGEAKETLYTTDVNHSAQSDYKFNNKARAWQQGDINVDIESDDPNSKHHIRNFKPSAPRPFKKFGTPGFMSADEQRATADNSDAAAKKAQEGKFGKDAAQSRTQSRSFMMMERMCTEGDAMAVPNGLSGPSTGGLKGPADSGQYKTMNGGLMPVDSNYIPAPEVERKPVMIGGLRQTGGLRHTGGLMPADQYPISDEL